MDRLGVVGGQDHSWRGNNIERLAANVWRGMKAIYALFLTIKGRQYLSDPDVIVT